MQVISWILLGFVAGGIIAISVKDTKKSIIFLDLLLGAVGGSIGGILTTLFTLQNISGVYDETILLVVIGAGLLIWLGRSVLKRNIS